MSSTMQLIVCTFDAVAQAEAVKAALESLDRRLDAVKLGNIAVVQKTPEGLIGIDEKNDPRETVSGIVSSIVGGAAYFLYAFAGLLGAQAEQLAQQQTDQAMHTLVRDMGFPDDALQQIGERMSSGSSAIITIVNGDQVPLVIGELERLGGTIIQHAVSLEVEAALTQQGAQ